MPCPTCPSCSVSPRGGYGRAMALGNCQCWKVLLVCIRQKPSAPAEVAGGCQLNSFLSPIASLLFSLFLRDGSI